MCWNCDRPGEFRDSNGLPFCSNHCAHDYYQWLRSKPKDIKKE